MLEPNTCYQIVKAGASLERSQCEPGSARYHFVARPLRIGDVVTYQGERHGPGSDNINRPVFSINGFTGEFQPNFWGAVDPVYLMAIRNAGEG